VALQTIPTTPYKRSYDEIYAYKYPPSVSKRENYNVLIYNYLQALHYVSCDNSKIKLEIKRIYNKMGLEIWYYIPYYPTVDLIDLSK
jgi:hypothetical protein